MLLDRILKWDPKKEQFIDDDKANNMVSRVMQSLWHLYIGSWCSRIVFGLYVFHKVLCLQEKGRVFYELGEVGLWILSG